MSRTPVGFVGLGAMGSAIAERLGAAHALTVFDVDPDAIRRFLDVVPSATAAPSLAGLRGSAVVFLSLPTTDDVEVVLLGEDGLAAGLAPDSLVVDMTTGYPPRTRAIGARLAERGIHLVDAPVSGGPQGARAGTLAIMIGGDATAVSRAMAVLADVSPRLFDVGELGSGQVVKLCNNLLAASNRVALLETLAVAVANGITPSTCLEVVNASSGASNMSSSTFPRITLRGLPQDFSLGLLHKDVALAAALAEECGTPGDVVNAVRGRLQVLLGELGATTDLTELVGTYEEAAGAPFRTGGGPE